MIFIDNSNIFSLNFILYSYFIFNNILIDINYFYDQILTVLNLFYLYFHLKNNDPNYLKKRLIAISFTHIS